MKALRIAWILSLVLFIPLMGVSIFTHTAQNKEDEKVDSNLKNIKIKSENLKKEGDTFKKLEQKSKIAIKKYSETKDNWWYLGEMEGIRKKFRPLFRNISSSKIKDGENFTKLSRMVNISSTFPEAVNLIDNLENAADFQIDGLKIIESNDDSSKHKVEFWMSFLRIKPEVMGKITGSISKKAPPRGGKKYYERSLRLTPTWRKGARLVVKTAKRDPFINLKRRREEWLAKLQLEKEANEKTFLDKTMEDDESSGPPPPMDISKQLVLKGIIDIKGTKLAIMDAKYQVVPNRKNLYRYNVKTGDLVGQKEVVQIEHKKVTLKAGNKTYYTIMP